MEYLWYVTFQAQPARGLSSEVLALTTIAAPGGGTLLRADGEVVWLSERSPGERVPAGVRSVDVERESSYERVTLRRNIGAPASVRRIVSAIEALPIVQPGSWSCPAEPVGPVVRLSFHDRKGKVLAVATQAAGEEVGNCRPMGFSVRGRQRSPLARGASVIDLVSQAVGLPLLPGSGGGR